ncbi:putative sodium symporter protein [Deinococcus proteolyticus MRP]|uniref:Putative sodium symporter protein n=1 Tax=Deinococcus proteolyticus (strain ATCC 35074 / DSM 20540 / JCM 6276 / NBRC 101906 / NCIMB 13154 / VKM Ac-1939 / CCM 2703 / MRP) TaxID=693977 RepID=F0RJN6_DEIPM|nr:MULTISPECIES: sodium:solute symporter family protein [Deinococcus]ADY26606.1 putative sodium symporter protein [Deinococcus proteolyticus MRP]MCY1702732.1 cation acetate symporter [Deinococcus sp. SL84]
MNDVQLWTYGLIIATFALYIGIAYATRVRDTKSFYVAGQGIAPVWNGMAIAADWMSGASFLSLAGIVAALGYDGSMYLMGWTGGYVLLALLVAPFLRKFGKFTVPDFVGDRYGSNLLRGLAALTAVLISMTYIAGQMRGVGVVFSRTLDVSVDIGVMLGAVIVFFYAGLSGMKGITWTQVTQYLVLILAFIIPPIVLSGQLTGNPVPQISFMGMVPELNSLLTELGFPAYTEQLRSMTDKVALTMALMLGTAGLPHVITRFFTTPDVKGARTSAIYALGFIAVLYTTVPALSVIAKSNLINRLDGTVYAEAPGWFTKWENTGLLKHADKNGDGIIQYRPGKALLADGTPDPKNANELHFDNDILVMATPEIAGLAPWVIGLVAAGAMAAALSTASGLLITISGAVAHDIYYKLLRPDASESARLNAGRLTVLVASVLAAYFGINPPGLVAETVAMAFGIAAATFAPMLILGIFDKRMNWQGATAGLLVGLLCTAAYIWYFTPSIGGPGTPDQYLFGISTQGFGTIGLLLNVAVSLLVSRLTPPPSAETQAIVESVRYPDGAGAAQVH